VTYELWDLETRNCLGTFASRREAFDAVRSLAQEQPDMVSHLELAGEDASGEQLVKVTGQELADLARAA
jgi:hypothetical protein